VNKKDLVDLLKQSHSEKLPEWSVILNKWGIPEGFPADLPVYNCDTKEGRELCFNDPAWRMAVAAIDEILGEAGTSKAWWTIQLGKTESEWEDWYAKRDQFTISIMQK